MHALADWIAKLVQILNCIKVNMCIVCSIVDQAHCNSGPFWCILVDLFVHFSGPFIHSSGPFGGPSCLGGGGWGVGGVLQNPDNPPGYGLAYINTD